MKNDELFELTVAIKEKLIQKKETLINTDNVGNISNKMQTSKTSYKRI